MASKRGRSARENARRRASEHKSGGGKDYIKAFRLPANVEQMKIQSEGSTRFDILEYEVKCDHNPWAEKGDMHFERTYFAHRLPDPSSEKGYSSMVLCPKKNFGKPCPVCEWIAGHDSNDPTEAERAKDYRPKERQLFNVVDTLDREKGTKVFDFSYHCFGRQLDAELDNMDDDDDFDTFPEYKNGKTLKVAWEEKTMGSIYYEASSINFKDRKEDYENPTVYDLDSLLVCYTYDTIEGILDGQEVSLEEDTDEAPKRKAKKQSEPEEDEEDDDTAEEAEEAPKRKAKKKPEPEEDEEDDEGSNPCPSGHKYGVDNDQKDDCDDCDIWEKCFKAGKKMKK